MDTSTHGNAINRIPRGTSGIYEVWQKAEGLKHTASVCLVPLKFGIL